MGQLNPRTTLDPSAVCYTCKGEGRDIHVHVYDGSVLNNSDNVTFTKHYNETSYYGAGSRRPHHCCPLANKVANIDREQRQVWACV